MPLSRRDFQDHLRTQLAFLSTSAARYDRGDSLEAIRLGTALRIIFHDGRPPTTSLLTHLQAWDTATFTRVPLVREHPNEPPGMTPIFERTFGAMIAGPGGILFAPDLHIPAPPIYIRARQWWEQEVWRLDADTTVSRQMIIRAATNQDGGAHVDSSLDATYERLRSSIGGLDITPPLPHSAAHTHLVCLRTFAWEVLNSPALATLAG